MNMSKYGFYAALAAAVLVAGTAAPATGQSAERRSERAERSKPTDTPYSNRSVRREREAKRIVREIERERASRHYRFANRREVRD